MQLLNIVVDGVCKGTVVDPENGSPLRYYFFDKAQESLDLIIDDLLAIKLRIAKGEVKKNV